jgi:hypothetical protein|tara:strand:- start:2736 stop:2963 length:228 start_codon:yes stop_codon:yes gene_type:complete
MGMMKNMHEELLQETMDVAEDKMCEDMFCMSCGESDPLLIPTWSGKENWYNGWCKCTPNEPVEFVYSPTHNGDDI